MKRCVLRQQHILAPCVCVLLLTCIVRAQGEEKRSFTAGHKSPGLFSLRAESQLHAGCCSRKENKWKLAGKGATRGENSLCPPLVSWKVIACWFSWRRFATVSFSYKSSAFISKLKMERRELVDISKAEQIFSALVLTIIYIGCIASITVLRSIIISHSIK